MVPVANKALINKANKIIQLVLTVDCSCADLYVRAQLLHKLGNDPEATRTAQEAVVLATKDKTYTEGATELLVEISQKKDGLGYSHAAQGSASPTAGACSWPRSMPPAAISVSCRRGSAAGSSLRSKVP